MGARSPMFDLCPDHEKTLAMIEKVNSEQARALNLGRVFRRLSGVHDVVLI